MNIKKYVESEYNPYEKGQVLLIFSNVLEINISQVKRDGC